MINKKIQSHKDIIRHHSVFHTQIQMDFEFKYEIMNLVWIRISNKARDQVDSLIWRQVWRQTCFDVEKMLNKTIKLNKDQAWNQIARKVYFQAIHHIRTHIWDKTDNQIWNHVWTQVYTQVSFQIKNQIYNQIEKI